jgi:catabolite regulation protein CreA
MVGRWKTLTGMLAAAPLAVALVAVSPMPAAAHAGHVHKVMGTVTMVGADHVMVKAKEKPGAEEKTVTIMVNAKTKILKGTTAATLKDLSNGQRIVADVGDGKEPLTAREIKIGAAAPAHAGTH